MPTFRTRRSVPFTPRQMFDLVADVERYPEFVPLCEGLRVKERSRVSGHEVLLAEMDVGYGALRETFGSKVTLDAETPCVMVEYLDGPFQYLDNRWVFEPSPDGCDVDFYISYELKSLMLQLMVGAVFERAFRRFSEAFERRAQQIYGAPRSGALTSA
ncbi:MAG: type II toxin-antitoxin system RatA family toxin [Hyphomicrobiaceae bacterium]